MAGEGALDIYCISDSNMTASYNPDDLQDLNLFLLNETNDSFIERPAPCLSGIKMTQDIMSKISRSSNFPRSVKHIRCQEKRKKVVFGELGHPSLGPPQPEPTLTAAGSQQRSLSLSTAVCLSTAAQRQRSLSWISIQLASSRTEECHTVLHTI